MLLPSRISRVLFRSLILATFLCGGTRAAEQSSVSPGDTLVYVGTYTGGKSKGIYLFKLQTEIRGQQKNVTLIPLGLAAELASPSFLAIDAQHRRLFAVTESDQFEGKPSGAVSAYAIDPKTGKLELLNQQSTKGGGPCHLALDRDGRHVFVANYGGGSVAVLPVGDDGRLGEASDFVQHKGKSINPERQDAAYAHCVTLDPTGRFLFVCDLGLDQVLCYKFDAKTGKLTPNDPPFAAITPGAGPRHMVFRPDGRFAYVINELNSTVTAFAYDAKSGRLTELQNISTLPKSFVGENTTAEIDIHPSGKFLYGSNRGRDSIVLFAVNRDDGTLTYFEDLSTTGKTPRHFGLHPAGDLMAIGHQDSDTIQLCQIDGANGRLKPVGEAVEAPMPVCIVFLPPESAGQ
jgi:6-phosphogluconolactonase